MALCHAHVSYFSVAICHAHVIVSRMAVCRARLCDCLRLRPSGTCVVVSASRNALLSLSALPALPAHALAAARIVPHCIARRVPYVDAALDWTRCHPSVPHRRRRSAHLDRHRRTSVDMGGQPSAPIRVRGLVHRVVLVTGDLRWHYFEYRNRCSNIVPD